MTWAYGDSDDICLAYLEHLAETAQLVLVVSNSKYKL